MPTFDYDMIVIGSGPAGQRAAIQAAKLNKRVVVAERKNEIGGACINQGTIPSKTLREAVLRLSGYRDREMYGASYSVKEHITMDDLKYRVGHVQRHEYDILRHQLVRNDVEMVCAEASFQGGNTVRFTYPTGGHKDVTGARVVIATGTAPTRTENVPFDGVNILTSDDVFAIERLPRAMVVIGAGVIGLEYACIFCALGVRVTVIDKRRQMLDFVDDEIMDTLSYHLRSNRTTLRLGEEVSGVEWNEDEHKVRINLASGKEVLAEKALYSIGRTGATRSLNLDSIGLESDDRLRLVVNEHFQTSVPYVYAVGDVIGFPSLAATSMEQGRLAACHAFGRECSHVPELFPFGIYTIPEISMVGKTEEELTDAGIPYEVGKAQYKEIARGQILGDSTGLLKLIFHHDTRDLLGVHIIGEGASELIHIGQAVLSFQGKIDYFVNTVFNYPTLAECYKTAAFDGINRLG